MPDPFALTTSFADLLGGGDPAGGFLLDGDLRDGDEVPAG